MTDSVKAWQCIGCGRIDHPATCIGVCDYRPVDMVYAEELEAAQARIDELTALLRRLALTTPMDGQWERSYRALQARARVLLGLHAEEEQKIASCL